MFHNFLNIADIDECAELGNQICINGVCRNRIGGFSCQCNIGYTLDDSRRNCRGRKAQRAALFHFLGLQGLLGRDIFRVFSWLLFVQ